MLNSRYPVTLMKGAIGLCLAILMLAPVAVLWSAGPTLDGKKDRQPIFQLGPVGQVESARLLELERSWAKRWERARYARPADNWPQEMGSRRIGRADVTELRSSNLVILPNSKGYLHTDKKPLPEEAQIADPLRKGPGAPARRNGEYFIAQFRPSALDGKDNNAVRQAITDLGGVIIKYVPNNAYLVRVPRQNQEAFTRSSLFQYAGAYEPAYKIHPATGGGKRFDPEEAASPNLNIVVRLHPGESAADVERDIARGNGQVKQTQVINDTDVIIAAQVDRHDIFRLARNEAVASIEEFPEYQVSALATSITTEMGRFIDPRVLGGRFLRPFTEEGLDGGGIPIVDPNAGCPAYNTSTGGMNLACFSVKPQYIGVVDDGISLDAHSLANSTSAPCTSPADCSGLPAGSGVGPTHRKVDGFTTSRDKIPGGPLEDAAAGGDFASCDDVNWGGTTHGQIVVGTMMGNPSLGPFGLGRLYADVDVANQFFGYFNDTNEKNFPYDGQARSARLVFEDAHTTPTDPNGLAPGGIQCATGLRSDVNPGASVVDDVTHLFTRGDDPNAVAEGRVPRVIVLPFGHPVDHNDSPSADAQHNAYTTASGSDAEALDAFLFRNRSVAMVIPVGNDGSHRDTGDNVDPKVNPADPNDPYTAADIQVNSLASGKNVITVGAMPTDGTGDTNLGPIDPTEDVSNYSSKGPATFDSDRMAPLVIAAGSDVTGGAREGHKDDDWGESHAIIASFDNDQAGPVISVRVQGRAGTSFSAGKVGGAAAQIRDYFAQGYYPEGVRTMANRHGDVSGMLVKALIALSADFATENNILSCQNKFCIGQGYGKVELANALPLKTYSVERRPVSTTNGARQADVPNNIAVVDELWNGGLADTSGNPYGVIALATGDPTGASTARKFRFRVTSGHGSLRAVLSWYDKANEFLVNDLDLRVKDGDFDFTSFGNPASLIGSGLCDPVNGFDPSYCGNCIADDQAYFDPNGVNDWYRVYMGNNFNNRVQFSQFAQCDPNTGLIDPNNTDSQPDRTNATEMVYLYHSNPHDTGVFGGIFGDRRDSGSEGFFEAEVRYPDLAGVQMGAPDTPCVVDGAGDGIDGAALLNDHVVTTGDGLAFIASGVDDPNTGADEAKCDSTAVGDDLQLVPSGSIGQPFALAITGPIAYAGAEGKSQVELDKSTYDCSDTALRVQIVENSKTVPSTTTIRSRVSILVIDPNGVEKDREQNQYNFTAVGTGVFRRGENLTFNNRADLARLQYTGGTGQPRINNNGIVEVTSGDKVRVVYDDGAPDPDVTAESQVLCQPLISEAFVLFPYENVKMQTISGGCDPAEEAQLAFGPFILRRGDNNLDAKEHLQYQVVFTNHGNMTFQDLRATLTCEDIGAGGVNDGCQYVTIVDPEQRLGRLPFGRQGGASWDLQIDENVVNITTSSEKVVNMKVSFQVLNSDVGGTALGDPAVFTFRTALQADNQRLFYSTDFPGGGQQVADYNMDGVIQFENIPNQGRREETEVRTYQTWAGTPNASLLTACASQDPNGPPGFPGSCIPFEFDYNNGNFSGPGTLNRMTGDSKVQSGYGASTQGWFYGTGGACGWQTASTSGAVRRGVWHAGQDTPGNAVGATCGTYVSPVDPTTEPENEFASWPLHTPVFNKMNQGTDARGFNFDLRLEIWAWNLNEQLQDADASIIGNYDSNIDDDGPMVLSQSYHYRSPVGRSGPRRTLARAQRKFGPRFDTDATLGNGNGINEVGIPDPLTPWDANDIFQKFALLNSISQVNLMAYPAEDHDGAGTFTSDVRGISTGSGGPCPTVGVGHECNPHGNTRQRGPVRNFSNDFGGSIEDFEGAAGNRFQFELNWQLIEGGVGAMGWTIDDVVVEWSEQHPADQAAFTGGDCTVDSPPPAGTIGRCGPDAIDVTTPVDTCSADSPPGVAGTFCRGGQDIPPLLPTSLNKDCRLVRSQGTCVDTDPDPNVFVGECTTGLIGRSCTDKNDCDLGTCVGGNTELGCLADADCNHATNDCDAIPFRPHRGSHGSAFTADQCATIQLERLYTYDCTTSLKVTVQDTTPKLATCPVGTDPNRLCVQANARTAFEPLGETITLVDDAVHPGEVFAGEVTLTALNDQPGLLFESASPAFERFTMTASYDDPECDLDRDGQLGETDFLDTDGDGVKNAGADNVVGDQDPVKNYLTGGPVSNDDNCFDALTLRDSFNPADVAQLDLDNNANPADNPTTDGVRRPRPDGKIDSNDCIGGAAHPDPNHNSTGQCDFDSDGAGDLCDNCPVVANADQQDTDGDGIGNVCEENDIDHDGKANNNDNCPTVYNPSQSSIGGGGGGNQRPRGLLCDSSNQDFDNDGFFEAEDNCPNETIQENGSGGSAPGPCPGACSAPPVSVGNRCHLSTECDDLDPNTPAGACTPGGTLCTYNPTQLDQDGDGLGDLCDVEDFDSDSIPNIVDSCPTAYNPIDPDFPTQTDSDGDSKGDDRNGTDIVGVCQPGSAAGEVLCIPVGTGANCGAAGFCLQRADAYCDPDSQDDNDSTIPDDLTSFSTEIVCNYAAGGFGGSPNEIASVAVTAVILADDGTADPVCTGLCDANSAVPGSLCVPAGGSANCGGPNGFCVGGDPNPNNNTATVELCHDPNAPNNAVNARCDTPGFPGTGTCTRVPDGISDAGEETTVRLSLANQSTNRLNQLIALSNVTVGIRSLSPTVGCVPKGQVFIGGLPTTGTTLTPAGALSFILSTTTGQSTPTRFTEARFLMTLVGDGPSGINIEGTSPDQSFNITGDSDQQFFPPVPASANGALGSAHSVDGAVCEDFDTNRNGTPGIQWQRLYLTDDPNQGNLYAIPVQTDDILGSSQDGGLVPFGTDGQQCTTDTGFAAARVNCYVIDGEDDWHLHSTHEGCDDIYDSRAAFDTRCAADERAHSGLRSMHLGRHLSATSTLQDTLRMRQVSAFVLDTRPGVFDPNFPNDLVGLSLGTNARLDFWHIISNCDQRCLGTPDLTTGGGILQSSKFNPGTNRWGAWEKLTATQNGYDAADQELFTICEFDPGDDGPLATQESSCGGLNQWAGLGDVYGTDTSCTTNTAGADPTNLDCGQTTNRTVVGAPGCSWVADPTCGNFLENGSAGTGVWARSQFSLQALAAQTVRLRWMAENGGGWDFGEQRSFLEPEPGNPPLYTTAYDLDDGWYVDDICVTDVRTAAAIVNVDPTDGTALCAAQGDPNNCGTITLVIAGSAVDTRTGGRVLYAQGQAQGTEVTLDARQTTGTCKSGSLLYEWSRLDPNGSVAEVFTPFSPNGKSIVALTADTTYRLQAKCSSDQACTASRDVQVQVYPGDGSDIMNDVLDPNGLPLDGLRLTEVALGAGTCADVNPDPNIVTLNCTAPVTAVGSVCANNAACDRSDFIELTWRARPQPTGLNGFDLFKAVVSSGSGFVAHVFPGTSYDPDGAGPLTSSCNRPNAAAGVELKLGDPTMPPSGMANVYAIGHSSRNTLAFSPLGYDPTDSVLRTAGSTCP